MVEDAQMLETAGCSFVVIPCNTAHYFFEDIRNSVQIPVLNIIEETIDYAKKQGSQRKIPREIKKLGILQRKERSLPGLTAFTANRQAWNALRRIRDFRKRSIT